MEKRRESLSHDTSFIYARTKCIFSKRQWRPITFCIALSFIFSVHCQKNKKDEDKKDEEFRCPEGQGNGNFADPATCRRFYQVIHIINLSSNNYIRISHLLCLFLLSIIILDYLSLLRFILVIVCSYFVFRKCVDGYPYLNRCPSGLHFDDISKFCTFRNEARCGPIETSKRILLFYTD